MRINTPQRVIRYDGRSLADLAPGQPITAVLAMHAHQHPELASAVLEGPVNESGSIVYTAKTNVGTKG